MTDAAQVVARVKAAVRRALAADSTGHDYYHVERVARVARQIAAREGGDATVCELAGWTHDLCRPMEKETGLLHFGPEALAQIDRLLKRCGVPSALRRPVIACIAEHEQYGFNGYPAPESIESRVLQDADRIDALGAIGIARVFMFAGAHGNALWIPDEAPGEWNPTIRGKSAVTHFYEKILKLPDEMHTATGRSLAMERKQFVERFIDQLLDEWRG